MQSSGSIVLQNLGLPDYQNDRQSSKIFFQLQVPKFNVLPVEQIQVFIL
jgi:hypothetical protein